MPGAVPVPSGASRIDADGFEILRLVAESGNGQIALRTASAGSGAAAAPAAKTVGTSAVQLDTAFAGRSAVTVVNNGTAVVYIGTTGVTTSTGIPLAASGGTWTLPWGSAIPVYGISGTAGQDVRVAEY